MDITLHYTTAKKPEEPLSIIPGPPQNEALDQEDFTDDWLEWGKHHTPSNNKDTWIFVTGQAVISFTFYNYLFSKPIGLIRY